MADGARQSKLSSPNAARRNAPKVSVAPPKPVELSKAIFEKRVPVDTKKRICEECSPPVPILLDVRDVYGVDGVLNEDILFAHFKQEGRLTKTLALKLLNDTTAILTEEPNVIQIPAPVTIVGDIHGQFFDLPKLFGVGGHPKNTRYLFLGDYVVCL